MGSAGVRSHGMGDAGRMPWSLGLGAEVNPAWFVT